MPETTAQVDLDGQYRVLRELAGLVDRSERAKLILAGGESVDYLQGQITNDVEAVAVGGGCYAALLDRKGHMRADLRVLRVADDEVWLDTEAIAGNAVQRHLETYKIGRDVELADATGDRAIVSVIGPAAAEVTGAGRLSPEYAHGEIAIDGVRARAAATDVGIDLILADTDTESLREALTDAGAAEVSEAAAEILRVERGRPRFGFEMTEATIPAEAGIDERAVSFTKGCYIGQETVARLHYKGKPNRHLRGLRLDAPASRGDAILLGDREVGAVGTACVSPALGPIALAIVRREAEPGARVRIGESGTEAELVELPFS
jgi:tRNA-modifying protein YgfZ